MMTNIKRLVILVVLASWLSPAVYVTKACCVGECPDPYCEYRAGPGIQAAIGINGYPCCDTIEICQRRCTDNPEGVDTAEEWWDYLKGNREIIVSDEDGTFAEWWEGPYDTDPSSVTEPCGCEYHNSLSWFDDNRFVYTWTGSVDLTVEGTYHLICTIRQPPVEPPHDPFCGPLVNDPAVTVTFTVVVWTGQWVLRDQSQGGAGLCLKEVWYDPICWPQTWCDICGGHATFPPGAADLETVAGNCQSWNEEECVIRSHTWTTGGVGHWVKAWRWERGDGEICECEAEPRTFPYEIVLEANAHVEGNADVPLDAFGFTGRCNSSAQAAATIALVGGFNHQPADGHFTEVYATGNAAEAGPSFSFSFSFTGLQAQFGSGEAQSYSESANPPFSRAYTGSVEAGCEDKEIKLKVITTGVSHSYTYEYAYDSMGEAELDMTSWSFGGPGN